MKRIKWLALALLLIVQVQGEAAIQTEKQGLFETTTITRGDVAPDPPEPGGEPTPLGSGLLVLTGLAAGYALMKGKRNEED